MTAPDPANHPLPWLRIVSIAVVMTIGVSLLWAVIRQVDDSDVPVDEPSPTETTVPSPLPTNPGSTATPPRESTPEPPADPAWPAGSLPAMLGYAPDRLADDSLPLNDIARYADIAGWMAALGIPTPVSLDDPNLPQWEAALDPLALPASLRERGLDPAWARAYGFDLTQVDQILVVGQSPDYVMAIRGSFDPEAMQAAWVASGYQPVELEGQTVWSLYPGDQIDLSAQESRPAMGQLNNVILLDDGTLLAASKMSRLGSALRVVNGDAASLAENDDIAALLVPGSDVANLASAVIAKGSLLQGTEATMPQPMATPVAGASAATPAVATAMPEVRLALVGIPLPVPVGDAATPAPAAGARRMVVMLVMDDGDAARSAVRAVRVRLTGDRSPVTGEPYADRLANPALSLVSAERPLVIVEGELANGPADWLAIVSDRDLGYAFWLPEP